MNIELKPRRQRTDWGGRGEHQRRNSRSICERHPELSLSVGGWRGGKTKEQKRERQEQNYFGKKDSDKVV
jgi:hypothetical protein